MRRRRPECGRMISFEQLRAKLPPDVTYLRENPEEVMVRHDMIPFLMKAFGCRSVPHPNPDRARIGALVFECQLCGVRVSGVPCDAELHDAYYRAVENGEREPIEWKGDERER